MQDGRLDRRVGQDDRQHRRHPRMDHPDALGDAGDPDRGRRSPSGPGSVERRPSPTFVRESVVRSATATALEAHRRWRARPSATSVGDPGRDLGPAAAACRSRRSTAGGWRRPGPAAPRRGRRRPRPGRRRRPVPSPRSRSRSSTTIARPARTARRPPASLAARCSWESRTGAAAKAFGVNTAAAAAGPPSATHDRQVGSTRRLDPGGDGTGDEPRRHGGAALDRRQVDRAAARAASSGRSRTR